MAGEWPRRRLGEVLQLEYGASLPSKVRQPGSVPVIGSAGRVGFHNRPLVSGPGIVIGRKGSIGQVTWVPTDFFPIDTTYYVVPVDGRADLRWVYHVLSREDLARLNRATGVPGLHRDDVQALMRLVPPLPEQRAIAAVLDAIDEVIQRTETVIEANERVRKSLLHELLVRGMPGWHKEWKQVPSIGKIPACWDVARLGDVSRPPEYGAGASARPYDSRLPRYVRITDIGEDGRLRSDDLRSADPEQVRGYDLSPGDLLFARSGATVGKTYLYRSEDGPCVFAGYLIRFRTMPTRALPEYVELCTQTAYYERWVRAMLRAGAQPNINATEYASLPVPLPPLSEQMRIVALCDGVRQRLDEERSVLRKMALLKASAADALLTGGLRVQAASGVTA